MPDVKPALPNLLPALAFLLATLPALPAAAADDDAPKTKILDATKSNILPDGTTLNTPAIQNAIDTLSSSGGGTLRFPAGRYLTGTVQLKSNVTLRLDDNATLLGSTDPADYRNLDPFTDGSGNPLGHALIVAADADHVSIVGPGTIDGQGAKLASKQHPFTVRPFLVRFVRCKNVSVRDARLTNPGAWTLNFFQTDDAVVEHVTIRSRDQKLRNNDGINIDSSQHIQVRNCDVVSGDDALVIKSTGPAPSSDISASDCKLSTRTNAIKLGTESYGGFENISVTRCLITDTKMSGIALYTVDGGDLQHVSVSDVAMDGVAVPICIRLGSRLKTFRQGDQPKPAPGHLRDVTIKHVTAKNVDLIGLLINGVPGHPVENLTLDDIHIETPGGGTEKDAQVQLPEKESAYPEYNMFGKTLPASGLYARHVRGLTLHDLQLTPTKPDARPATLFIDVQDLHRTTTTAPTHPAQNNEPSH